MRVFSVAVAKALLALELASGLHGLVGRVRAKVPAVGEPGAQLAPDVPLMAHLETLVSTRSGLQPVARAEAVLGRDDLHPVYNLALKPAD